MPQRRAIPESIRSGKNATGSTIAAKRAVKWASGDNENVSLPAANTDALLGVTMAAISDGLLGDIQLRGRAICTSGAAITAKARVTVDTDGKVVPWAAAGGQAVLGTAINAATGIDEEIEVELAGPDTFGIS